jgi:hypothetical protein
VEWTFEHEHGSPSDDRPKDRGGAGMEFQCLEFCPICRTADVVRATMPEEFREHWHTVQRESLLAMRALLDHYIRHLEQQRSSSVPVEDIPIE